MGEFFRFLPIPARRGGDIAPYRAHVLLNARNTPSPGTILRLTLAGLFGEAGGVNILSRTSLALLAMILLSALGAHGAGHGIRIHGAPEPDLYVGYFPRGFCRLQLFTNAPPLATMSIWKRPGIALNPLVVTNTAVFHPNRRVEADFGEHGSYRGRMRKDGRVIVGRLRARNFPDAKNVNRVLRLAPPQVWSSSGFGVVILLPQPASMITNVPPHPQLATNILIPRPDSTNVAIPVVITRRP